MGKNEKTSPRILKIASKALRGKPITKTELRKLAGSALTQGANKKRR